MAPNFRLLIGLIIASFLVCIGALANGTRVNLLHPHFIRASIESSYHIKEADSDLYQLNISLWTRAAQYRLSNIWSNGNISEAQLERVSEWKVPKISSDDFFQVSIEEKPGQGEIRHYSKLLDVNSAYHIRIKNENPPTYRDFCELTLDWPLMNGQSPSVSLCVKDGFIHLIPHVGNHWDTQIARMKLIPSVNNPEIQRLTFTAGVYHSMVNGSIGVYLFSDVGQVMYMEVSVDANRNFLVATSNIRYFDLNAISNASPDNRMNDILKANKDLHGKAWNKLEKVLPLAYVRSITPRLSFNPDVKGGNITNWCLSTIYDQPTEGFKCTNDKIQRTFGPKPDTSLNVLTMHQLHNEKDDIAIEHYVFVSGEKHRVSSDTESKLYAFYDYRFCRVNGTYNGTITITQCSKPSLRMFLIPDAIIGYHGQCHTTISIIGPSYRVFNWDSPIMNTDIANTVGPGYGKPFNGSIENMYFKIKAALTYENDAYMFTYTNLLVKVPIKVEYGSSECSSLKEFKFDFANMKEMRASNFLINHVFMGDPTFKGGPMIYDYQELEEGASDTKPTMAIEDANTDVPIEGEKKPPKKSSSSGTMVIIIAVGLILGGLILAGMIYLFCLRSERDSDTELGRNQQVAEGVAIKGSVPTIGQAQGQGSGQGPGLSSAPRSADSPIQSIMTVRSGLGLKSPKSMKSSAGKVSSQIRSPASKSKNSRRHKQSESPLNSPSTKTTGSKKSRSPAARPIRGSPGPSKGSKPSTKSSTNSPSSPANSTKTSSSNRTNSQGQTRSPSPVSSTKRSNPSSPSPATKETSGAPSPTVNTKVISLKKSTPDI